MKLILAGLLCLFAASRADTELSIEEGGKYNFRYSLDDAGSHRRQETAEADGSVSGSYSYVDPNGDTRTVSYKAGPGIGFQPSGDISVDRVTAEEAAKLAELAPKAPELPEAEVKVPASPFTLPLYHAPAYHHAAPAYHHAAPLYHGAPAHHPDAVVRYAAWQHPGAYHAYPGYHQAHNYGYWY